MVDQSVYPDPATAARGDIPERYARALLICESPDASHALVLLGTNEPPRLYPYQVVVERVSGGWLEGSGSNGSGWSSMSPWDAAENLGVLTLWGEAPAGTSTAVITHDGQEHRVAVVDGYWAFAAWDVPSEAADWPVLARFE